MVAHTKIINDGCSVVNAQGFETKILSDQIAVLKYTNTGPAQSCKYDLTTAIVDAINRPANIELNEELGGMILTPGVYKSFDGFTITNNLTLDGQNDCEAAWIFIMATNLKVNIGAQVVMNNFDISRGVNVWWICGTSAEISSNATLKGTLMAQNTITVMDRAITGPLLSEHDEVLMHNSMVHLYNFTTTRSIPEISTGPKTIFVVDQVNLRRFMRR